MSSYKIRKAEVTDCSSIRNLIVELAVYEKMEDQVKISVEELIKDGFGDQKYYHCLVAETNNEGTESKKMIGYALYYYMYSTWEGKFIYMEDLYVQPEYRGRGIGTALWKTITKEAVDKNCQRVQWAVLDWNTPSIEYYKRQGGINLTKREGWNVFRMCRPEMEKFINK